MTDDAWSGAVPIKRMPGDCMGDASRGQGAEPSQLGLTLNSDGILQTEADAGAGPREAASFVVEGCAIVEGRRTPRLRTA